MVLICTARYYPMRRIDSPATCNVFVLSTWAESHPTCALQKSCFDRAVDLLCEGPTGHLRRLSVGEVLHYLNEAAV